MKLYRAMDGKFITAYEREQQLKVGRLAFGIFLIIAVVSSFYEMIF